MRNDTPSRRAWILAHHDTHTLRQAVEIWDVDANAIRHDERALGVRMARERPRQSVARRPSEKPVVDGVNATAAAWLRQRWGRVYDHV